MLYTERFYKDETGKKDYPLGEARGGKKPTPEDGINFSEKAVQIKILKGLGDLKSSLEGADSDDWQKVLSSLSPEELLALRSFGRNLADNSEKIRKQKQI